MRIPYRFVLRTLVSIGVSFLVLALLMKLVAGSGAEADRPQLFEVLRSVVPPLVGAYVLLALLQAFFRAVRYRVLIAASGEAEVPDRRRFFLVTLTRNMLVDLLPARIGELSYVAMLNRGYRVSGSACVSSLGISFAFDLVALLIVLIALVVQELFAAGVQGWLLPIVFMLSLIVLAVLAFLFYGIPVATRLLNRMLGAATSKPIVQRTMAFLSRISDAIEVTRTAGVMGKVLALSLGVRTAKYLGLYLLFLGITIPSFPELADTTFGSVLAALLSAEAGASVPIPAFMSFGTYEAGGTLAFTLLGVPADAANVLVLAQHIWSQVADYTLGGLGFVLFLFTTGGVAAASTARKKKAGPGLLAVAVLLAVFVGAVFLAFEHRKLKKLGALRAPPSGTTVATDAKDLGAAGRVNGFIVWSSNRNGNHDILKMDLPGGRITSLTSHPHVDTFPRISPDGTRVVFVRSQTPWVSQRNPVPWDVFMVSLGDGTERLVARNGNTPTWSADGRKVYFQRDTTTFVEHELATGRERVLFRAGENHIPDSAELQTPSYLEAGQALAVTLRGPVRATAVFKREGDSFRVGGSGCCQIAWTPIPDTLVFIDHGGRKQNRVCGYNAATREETPWLDLPGEFSHEYFPRVSNDGKYMVLGASIGGRHQHEHDTSDYEIFFWEIGAPPEEAVRLTYHTGNDCWPDIFVRTGSPE